MVRRPPRGRVELVAVGGAAFLTNDRLARRTTPCWPPGSSRHGPARPVRFVDAPHPGRWRRQDARRPHLRRRAAGRAAARRWPSSSTPSGGRSGWAVPCRERRSPSRSPARSWWPPRVACSSAAARQAKRPRCCAAGCGATLRARLGVPHDASTGRPSREVVAERSGVDLQEARTAVGDHPVDQRRRARRRRPRRRIRPPGGPPLTQTSSTRSAGRRAGGARGGRQGRRRPGGHPLRARHRAAGRTATCCSRACRAWPRRSSPRRWRRRSTSTSPACSSRPT